MSLEAVDFSRKQAPQPRLSKQYVPGRHAETFWSEAEDAVLRETYANGGATGCRERLITLGFPVRSSSAIYARANKFGLKTDKQVRARRSHPPSPELDAKIKEAWPTLSGKGAVQRFADSIGVDRWVVSKRAGALGLSNPHRKEPPWSAAENALMARVPLHDPHKASRIFREHGFPRSPAAITVHAKRIGISRRRKDVLSARGASKVLGVDEKWITARCIDGTLEAEKRGTARLVQQGGDTWSIAPSALRRFVIEHLEKIDIRKVEKFGFVELLTDPANASQAAE